jgi:hypothetical protein
VLVLVEYHGTDKTIHYDASLTPSTIFLTIKLPPASNDILLKRILSHIFLQTNGERWNKITMLLKTFGSQLREGVHKSQVSLTFHGQWPL